MPGGWLAGVGDDSVVRCGGVAVSGGGHVGGVAASYAHTFIGSLSVAACASPVSACDTTSSLMCAYAWRVRACNVLKYLKKNYVASPFFPFLFFFVVLPNFSLKKQ